MFEFFRDAYLHRKILLQLVKRDLLSAHHGSVLGAFWVLIEPLAYIALTLCFFQFAIRGGERPGVSYVAWVLPQIVFWTFASSSISSSVSMVREYSFLLRHHHFDLRLVALIKISSAAVVHFILLAVVMTFLVVHSGLGLHLQTLSLIYFFVAMYALLLGTAWVISSLGVFWKDVRGVVSILLQAGFWISPIFWEPSGFPKPIAFVMYANPFFYPINGYRKSIIAADFGVPFWQFTLYYWCVVAVLLYVGSRLFSRLSKTFGDVL
ncbi:ABC transporter permease [Bradyrhizobium vignae]|uniref:Transport permease protein n=1 Tax=Bradyrhizobium vignae TaxID=1549949 RepID=A0A2U3PYH6_9BRAD|nr:ABC transporter permease [Bradyrhizobium vignae]SPP94156.1 putative ABC-2 type transporter [Bradyrhizobium vignae]